MKWLYDLFQPKVTNCENGYHVWGNWKRFGVLMQIRYCKQCNRQEIVDL